LKFILTGLGNWYRSWELIRGGVEEAEERGYWAVVFPDQYMWDPDDLGVKSYDDIDSTLETWTALSYLAAITQNIRLGTWVSPIPFRPPGILAKIVSTVDCLSSGRAILGVGAGVTKRMFEGYSQWDPPKVRVDKTREGVELILNLWTQDKTDYHGQYYNSKGAILDPKPVQMPHPPLLFGGAGKKMLRLAGRYSDICYIPPWNKMNPEVAREIVLDEAKNRNRENRVKFAFVYTPLGPTDHYDREMYGRKVEEASKNGFEYFITAFSMDGPPWEVEASSSKGKANYLHSLRDFADSFISSYAK